jgi:FkbM family methyltransferase
MPRQHSTSQRVGMIFLRVGRKLLRNTPLQKTKLVSFVLTQLMKLIGRSDKNNDTKGVHFRGAFFQMEAKDISILPSVLMGEYEIEELDFIELKIKSYVKLSEAITIIDIGANVGLYTVILGRHLRKSDTVVAVEPDPRNLKLLKANISSANLSSNVEIHEAAISVRQGSVDLSQNKHGGLSHISDEFDFSSIRVKSMSLDSLLSGIKQPARVFCKIDVEGFEFDVINSGFSSITKFLPDLLIEFGHDGEMKLENKWGRSLSVLFSFYTEVLYFLNGRVIPVKYEDFLILAGEGSLGNLWLSKDNILQNEEMTSRALITRINGKET